MIKTEDVKKIFGAVKALFGNFIVGNRLIENFETSKFTDIMSEHKSGIVNITSLSTIEKIFKVKECVKFSDYKNLKQKHSELLGFVCFLLESNSKMSDELKDKTKNIASAENAVADMHVVIDSLRDEIASIKKEKEILIAEITALKPLTTEVKRFDGAAKKQKSHPLAIKFVTSLSNDEKKQLKQDIINAYENDKRKSLTMERHIQRNGDAAVYPMFLTCLSRRNRLLKKWFERYDAFCENAKEVK